MAESRMSTEDENELKGKALARKKKAGEKGYVI